jgi:hypothetical protein
MSDLRKSGWVRLHRKIENNFLWFLEPFTKAQAWIDLFLNANHSDNKISIRGKGSFKEGSKSRAGKQHPDDDELVTVLSPLLPCLIAVLAAPPLSGLVGGGGRGCRRKG